MLSNRRGVKCEYCGRVFLIPTTVDPDRVFCLCRSPNNQQSTLVPIACAGECPGDEYEKLTRQLNAKPKSHCKCPQIKLEMNTLKVAGCQQHRERLIKALQDNWKENYNTWGDKLRALAGAIIHPDLALKLGTTDPLIAIEGMFDLALKNAEKVQ